MLEIIRNRRRRKRLIGEAISVLEAISWHHDAILEAVEEGASTEVPATWSGFQLRLVPSILEEMREVFE